MSVADAIPYMIAQVAGAVAARGDEGVRRRADLGALADRLDDVVVSSYAADVLSRLDARGGVPRQPPDLQTGGWRDVARLLVPDSPS